MSVATIPSLMTTDEMLALLSKGVTRWLIEGELREKPMTVRNHIHSRIRARTTRFLDVWADSQQQPRGAVLCGESGIRLSRNPDTTVGAEVTYVSAEVMAR